MITTKSALLNQANVIATEVGISANTKTRIGQIHTDTIDTALIFHTWLTPAQITSDQNDYSPTNLADNSVLRLDTDATRTITGIATGALGRVLVIQNIGTHLLILANDSASSTAGNRMLLGGASLVLGPGRSVTLVYDATSSRWRGMNLPVPRDPTFGAMWQMVSARGDTATRYVPLFGQSAAPATVEAFGSWVAKVPFTIYACKATHATALTTTNYVYTLRINGSDQASSVVTVNSTTTAGSTTGIEIAVAKDDVLTVKAIQSGSEAGATLGAKYWFEAA